MPRLRADFNGVFGDLLCLSHGDHSYAHAGNKVRLEAGMQVTAFDEDVDDDGQPDDLIASGTVEPAPHDMQCTGSRWVLRIEEHGIRHQSEVSTG
jgi:hypothetical protein